MCVDSSDVSGFKASYLNSAEIRRMLHDVTMIYTVIYTIDIISSE